MDEKETKVLFLDEIKDIKNSFNKSFDVVFKKIDKINDSLFGNGRPGLKTKLEKIEIRMNFYEKSQENLHETIEAIFNKCLLKTTLKVGGFILGLPAIVFTILKISKII